MTFGEIALLYSGFRLFLSCLHIDSPCMLQGLKNADIESLKLKMSSDTEDNDMIMSRIRIKARAAPGHRLLWHVTRPRVRKTFRIYRSLLPASTLYPLRLKPTQEIDYLLQSRAGEHVAFSPGLTSMHESRCDGARLEL